MKRVQFIFLLLLLSNLLAAHVVKEGNFGDAKIYSENFDKESQLFTDKLESLGYDGEVVLVTDGITGWKTNGFDIVNGDEGENSKPAREESHQLLPGLKPIVQVFGTASYTIENNRYGYSFGRAHLGFQYQFNQKWSAKIIIDRGRATSVGEITVTDADGNNLDVKNSSKEGAYYTLFLKFASLQWNVNEKFSLEGGALLQNHYITQERFWGFRYVAQTFQDLYWKIPSADLGFMARYKFNDIFSVDAALTNGEGPRIKQDVYGNVKYAAGLDINPGDKIKTRMYYHNRAAGTDNAATEQMVSVFTGCKFTDKFRVSGEFNFMDNLNNILGLNSYGFSVYSGYYITENTQLFARYDHLVYDTNSNAIVDIKGDGNTFMGGFSYSPVNRINLSLNYQGWIPDNKENQQENSIRLSMEYKF